MELVHVHAVSDDIFLFVNPKSGGNKGQDFLKVPQPFTADLENGHTAKLHIYSLPDNPDEGFRKLKAIADSTGKPVRCIVGGGDGTVMWADCVATQHGINTSTQIIYGIIPLGTGNDFSRVAGWGGKNPKGILNNDCRLLRDMVKWWARASVRPHDVWQCAVEVDDEDGKIMKVKGTGEEELPHKKIEAPLINYFSIGQESKVGVEFDKHRTKSQTCNLFVYAWEGLVSEVGCMGKQHIGDLVANMRQGTGPEAPLVFGSDNKDDSDSEEEEGIALIGNPESLMFLNVNSYAGGAGQFWQLETSVGLEPPPPDEAVDVKAEPGDGRIEVVTLPNIANIALDKLSHSGKRIHSGGPYYLEYWAGEDGQEQHVYCEIDGEFYHLVNPVTTSIVYLKKLQVLQNNVPMDAWMDLVRKGKNLPADIRKSALEATNNFWNTTQNVTTGIAVGVTGMTTGVVQSTKGVVDSLGMGIQTMQSAVQKGLKRVGGTP
mmetsp:Transcript_74539/g.155388  ORF Transcript_74539/g.155388 Transcript_74539/m.155388 type:complete len:488 (+) Transcript_74539:128-1591(+)